MLYTSFDNLGLVKVLHFLKAHRLEYLSGEDLSEVLKISRVAVWKHIKKIQTLGYKIESKQNLGYRLSNTTNLMLPWEITEGLKTKQVGKKVYYFDSVDSTQNFASSISKNPDDSGAVIISETQTIGKGRLGRAWISPKGGIWLSVVLRPSFDVSKITLIPLASAVALSRAIYKTLKLKTELKWPNDVTLQGKKVAGIIIDASIESNRIESIILGVGINFRIDAKEIEKKIKAKENFYGVASLLKKDSKTKPVWLVQSFLEELEKILLELSEDKARPVITQWVKRSSTIGKDVTIYTQNGKIAGRAIKLDKDGSLIIKRGSKELKVAVGDVAYKK